jgi:hypothetical protein
MNDFRPRNDPARSIYDALSLQMKKRDGGKMFIQGERFTVWSAARDYAQQHGLRVPTLAEVEKKEALALGHCDYAAKWAYGVADLLRQGEQS